MARFRVRCYKYGARAYRTPRVLLATYLLEADDAAEAAILCEARCKGTEIVEVEPIELITDPKGAA